MYHARLGRFISRDPIGYANGMGLYEYVGSRPVLGTDPLGRRSYGDRYRPIILVTKASVEAYIKVRKKSMQEAWRRSRIRKYHDWEKSRYDFYKEILADIEDRRGALCNHEDEGKMRSISSKVVFAPGAQNPTAGKYLTVALMALLAAGEMPTSAAEVPAKAVGRIRDEIADIPSGIESAADALKLVEVLSHGLRGVWMRAQDEKCECRENKYNATLEWVSQGEPKWIKCNLREIPWGKGRGGIAEHMIVKGTLGKKDMEEIKEQCEEQAAIPR